MAANQKKAEEESFNKKLQNDHLVFSQKFGKKRGEEENGFE